MLDTMTLTKVVGAFCGALLVYLMGGWLGEALYTTGGGHGAHEQAYSIDTGADEAADEAAEEVDFLTLVQNADAGAGERVFRQCSACHKINEKANAVGPYLTGVMGREIASIDGFSYSGALPAGEKWTLDNINAWITNPSGFAEGTSMSYSGLKDDEDRADLVAYLISKSPDYALPAEQASAEDAAPRDGADAQTASADAAMAQQGAPDAAAQTGDAQTASTDTAQAESAPAAEEGSEAAAEETAAGSADGAGAATGTAAAPAQDGTATGTAEASPFMAAYAGADPAAGEKVFRQCQACHVADKKQNRVGPHLVNVVGRPIGSVDGFRYSGALPDGAWTPDRLNAWLTNPREFAKGTSMGFAGLRDMQDRANVIAYLESLN